jgi:hypothetical protein
MKQRLSVPIGLLVMCALSLPPAARADDRVTLVDKRGERRVDVLIDGKPFTSYIYPASLQKPVLYPIRSAAGVLVTRGYPLEPRAGERADHPHHVGHWFNYGDVNGYDFWGHSDETPARNKPRMGVIVHKEITKVASGADRGELAVRADWVVPDGSTLLREETRFVFSGAAGRRIIDRITTWTAAGVPVTFKDTKEGAFGIRVARALDHPAKGAEVLVSATGGKEKVAQADNSGVTGNYIAPDGKTGEGVWGTRQTWMGLTGKVDGKPVTLAIFDHPSNHGHPTYWHARGYGLFAANPIGRQGYDPKQEPASLTLQPGQSVTFTHRILVRDAAVGVDELNKEHAAFAQPAGSQASIRIGLIGLDTSHAGAFTQLLNDPSRPDHVPGARVVAAYKGGSPDVEASANRIEKFTAELRDKWQIELVDSIEELVRRVDAVMLTSVDGRIHLKQARPVIAARKPLFIDKPLSASTRDALELARLARESGTPVFSSSSLRFNDDVVAIKGDPRVAEVKGAITWGPATLEPHHPDLFWYGVHAVEILYTFMGPGCERVSRVHTPGADLASCQWKDGRIGVVRGIRDGASAYGHVVFGPKAIVSAPAAPAATAGVKRSSYYGLVSAMIDFFRTGKAPVPLEETVEMMAFMEAADLSKARNGAAVALSEVLHAR